MNRSIAHWMSAASPAAFVSFGLCYFLAAELGHLLSLQGADAAAFATFWPPSGLLLAVLAVVAPSRWPPFLLAAGIANLISDILIHGQWVSVSLGFTFANCFEAVVGAWLLRRFVGTPLSLERVKGVLGLAGLSAALSTALAGCIGAGTAVLAIEGASFGTLWLTWWVADAVGVLVVAPIVMVVADWNSGILRRVRKSQIVEICLLYATLGLITQGVYGEWLPQALVVPVMILPFLLWAVLRFGPRGSAAAISLVAMIGVFNVTQGRGPYASQDLTVSQQVLRAQGTICVISISLMVVAALVAERTRAERERIALISQLEQALSEIRTLQGLIPLCAWCKNIRDDQGFWQRLEDYISLHTEAQFSHGICPDCLNRQCSAVTGTEG